MLVSTAGYGHPFYENVRILRFCLLLCNLGVLLRKILENIRVYVEVTNGWNGGCRCPSWLSL